MTRNEAIEFGVEELVAPNNEQLITIIVHEDSDEYGNFLRIEYNNMLSSKYYYE